MTGGAWTRGLALPLGVKGRPGAASAQHLADKDRKVSRPQFRGERSSAPVSGGGDATPLASTSSAGRGEAGPVRTGLPAPTSEWGAA